MTTSFTIIESKFLTVQRRFPRTKNRRIRKKWAKRPENFGPRQDVFVDTARSVIYAHPDVAQKLRAGQSVAKGNP